VNSNQKNLTKHQKNLASKKVTPQHGGAEVRQKNKQQTKTTKHTIEFSNNKTR
jgi:hypothetical protein